MVCHSRGTVAPARDEPVTLVHRSEGSGTGVIAVGVTVQVKKLSASEACLDMCKTLSV